MRALFVTYHFLHGNGGGVYASRGYVNAFAALAESMSLLCPVKGNAAPEGIDPSVRVIPVRYEKPRFLKFLDLLAGRLHRYYGVFDEVLASDRFDTVVFDACYASFGLIGKAQAAGCRVITIHHNYQCDYVRANYTFPVRHPMLFWTRICEGQAVRRSSLNLVLTEEDRRKLLRQYGESADIRVIGVFEYRSRPWDGDSLTTVTAPVFVITGNLSMRQTEIPLLELMDSCLPVLLEEVPSAKVLVAGRDPSERLSARCHACGIELIPSPRDMQEILSRGSCYICPASVGGGLKLRVMDGLRCGMPVLAHVAATRGYERFMDLSVFSYTDAESFRKALRRLENLAPGRQYALDLYRQVFSYESGVERLRNML